ncbi:tetratricopeptide repeat protein [Elizabethkingia anophelis]|uniref:tetratricopeptide repeat protein n=1 Tax=Elizabethkingia anophelis TaxID=1117645 RepID=UPI0021A87CFB|nr:tetratricopeptide repeat protein [Elizabethkingia anophelis]
MKKPNRHKNHILETESNKFFNNCLSNEWFADKPEHDYGIDYITHISVNGQVTGLNFSVQLKSKEKETNKQHVSISIKQSTLGLFNTRLEPILLVAYVQEDKEAYWCWYNDLNLNLTEAQKTVRINIPKENRLSHIDWNVVAKYVQKIFSIKTLIDSIRTLEYTELSNTEVLAWRNYYDSKYEESAFYFKSLLKQEHKDQISILEGLAHSQYMSFNYAEALQTINKCIELSGTGNQYLTKACILAEDGAKMKSKAKLLQAKNIFYQYLLTGTDNEIAHYNFGNTLNSLGDFEEAIKQYKFCLEINPNNAQAWKNLGSIYYELQDHEEEIKCYDKALKINPNLPQALFSKGVTLSHIYKKHSEGLSLLLKSIEQEEEMKNGFPLGYYWIAYTYEKLGKIRESLYYIDKGLSIVPENLFMLDFKTNLLASNYQNDKDIKSTAIAFFEYRLELNNNFKSLYHLIKIKDIKDEKIIHELIKKYTLILKYSDLDIFSKCELKLTDLLSFLLHYDKYIDFRKAFPLDRYIDHLMYGYYSISLGFHEIMDLIFAKSFSDAVEEGFNSENIKLINGAIFNGLSLFPKAIFELISDENFTHEEAVIIMAHVYAEYPMVAVREFGTQRGFIAEKLGFGEPDLENDLFNFWLDDLRDNTLFCTNRKLKLLKED